MPIRSEFTGHIRCQVFTKQENFLGAIDDAGLPKHFPKIELKPDHCSYWAPVFYPKGEETKQLALWRFVKLWFAWPNDSDTNEVSINDKILTLFQQQENAVLNQASQNTENLRQLHERIVVLRGMVFSLFILFLIFLCCYFAKVNGRSSHRMRKAFGVLLAVSLAFFCLLNGYEDLRHSGIFDIPVLESLLTVINIFGFVVVARGQESPIPSEKIRTFNLVFSGPRLWRVDVVRGHLRPAGHSFVCYLA